MIDKLFKVHPNNIFNKLKKKGIELKNYQCTKCKSNYIATITYSWEHNEKNVDILEDIINNARSTK